jgi:hypothetical protein
MKRTHQSTGDTFVVTSLRVDPDRPIFPELLDVENEPTFSVAEAGKMFARSPTWMRYAEDRYGTDGDVPVRRTVKGARVYDLPTLERLAHAFARAGVLDVEQLVGTLVMLQEYAYIWGVLERPPAVTSTALAQQ